jgi:hypothetical protein
MMREDTKLVKIFLDKSLIAKTQVGFISDNIENTKDSLKIHLRQSSIVDPFDVISYKDIHNQDFNISFPKHIVTTNLFMDSNKKKNDIYSEVESEMYCNLSIVLFDNMVGFLNYIIKFCNKLSYEDIDFAIHTYQNEILIDKKEDIFCHTIFTKKKISHAEDKLMPNECFGIIKNLFEIEFILFEELIKKNLARTNCIKFFNKMEKYREIIIYHNGIIPNKYKDSITYFSYKEIEGTNDLKLTLNKNEIENLIQIYNQMIYLVYKALITKYNLHNEIKRDEEELNEYS